jgi:hypothetical protein
MYFVAVPLTHLIYRKSIYASPINIYMIDKQQNVIHSLRIQSSILYKCSLNADLTALARKFFNITFLLDINR